MIFRSFGVKILSVCLFALLLQGCRKDSIEEHDILDKQQKEVGFRSGTFPVDLEADVRLWWENHRSTDMWDTVNPNILTLDPVWEFGYETWIGALPVFLVPVSNDLDEEIPDSRYNLIFFEADDEIDVRLLVFQSEDPVSGDWDLSTFTGCVFNIDQSTQVQGLHFFQDGYFIDFTAILQDTLLQDTLLGLDWPSWLNFVFIRCPKFGNDSKWWREFKHNLNEFFDNYEWGEGTGGGGPGSSWNGGYWSFWGPGNGPADFGSGFLGGGGGIGGNSSGPSPNHIPRSSNLLFSNEILNEGFRKLKRCDLNIDQKQDQASLGGFMAQAEYFRDKFDSYFSSGVDIYIQESGVRPLNDILQQPDHKWNWVNGHPYIKLLAPWARYLSTMIVSKKVSDLYKYCIQHPNANQAQVGNPSYSSDLCECMDQYSLGDANLDYTVDYLWTPEPFVTPNFAANVYSSWPLIHGLGIRYDVDAIHDFYFNECTTHVSPETFEDCAIGYFGPSLLTQLEMHLTLFSEIQDWILSTYTNLYSASKILKFIEMHSNDQIAIDYALFIFGMMMNDDEFKVDRFIELFNELKADPDFLLKDCGNSEEWHDLAVFVPPNNVLDRLHELGEGWRLQPLQTPSSAPRLNLDYFSITIDQIPINPMTGMSWTPEELFSHIRKNINDFVDVNLSEFLPFSSFDQELWLSNNPVKSIISIDIQGPDNGSVICGQSEDCCWIFSTIKAPMLPGFDGFHPVSGNRQFGYKLLSNGSLEIYTKGVDRFLFPTLPGGDPFAVRIDKLVGYLAEGVAFNGADNLWFSFMEGIKIFVEQPNYQGNANINSPIKHRPEVFQQFVEILRSNNPITKVPCAN